MNKTYAITSAGLAAFLLTCPGHAQAPASRQPVPKLSFAYAKDGGKDFLAVEVELAPGWHINSTKPLDEFLVPTSLQAEAAGFELGEQHWPKADSVHSPAAGGYMSLYSGKFRVRIDAKRGKEKGPPGKTKVTLHYQSCDNATCFPPKSVTVEK